MFFIFRRIPEQARIKTERRQQGQHHGHRERKDPASRMHCGDFAHFDHRDANRQQKNFQHVPWINDADDFVYPSARFFPMRPVEGERDENQPDDFQQGRQNARAKYQRRDEELFVCIE